MAGTIAAWESVGPTRYDCHMKRLNGLDLVQSMYNIHEAKTQFSRLVARAAAGEEIVITKAGRPMAKLVPFDVPSEPRRPGLWKGRVAIDPDFDAPDPRVEKMFEQ